MRQPGVDEFAVATDVGVGEDAVRAGTKPYFNVGAEFVPIELHPYAVKCLVGHEVTGRG